jgi:hypothetical protein
LDGSYALMRFLKSRHSPESSENAAAAVRLTAVTRRGKVEIASYITPEEPSEAEAPQRRFWTPEELTAETGRA